jgi:opacity protein-like surface antigen
MNRTRQIRIGIMAAALTLVFAAGARAQSDKVPKWELFGGYLHSGNVYTASQDNVSFSPGSVLKVPLCTADADALFGANFEKLLCDRNTFHGVDVAGTYIVSRHVGVTVDVTWQRHAHAYVDDFGPGGVQTSTITENKYSVFAGVQLKDQANAASVKPFAHALAGIVHEKLSGMNVNPVLGNSVFSDQPTSLGLKLGGGLDLRVSSHVDLRVIEFDYTPIFARDRDLTITPPDVGIQIIGRRADNVTLSFGIVWRR